MIPKTIHFCWFGDAELPKEHRTYIKGWSEVMPDFKIKLWNEENAPMHLPYMKKAFDNKKWANLSNYTRLHAVYEEGGIYLDTDVKVLKSFSVFLDNSCFFGLQTPGLEADHSINNAVFGAEKKHRFIKRIKEALLALYDGTEEASLSSPHLTTYFLRDEGYNAKFDLGIMENGIQLYPSEYFYPYHWDEEFTPDKVTENTYAIHFWNNSWWKKENSNPEKSLISRMLRFLKK